ncbi:hypothetical protein AAF712_010300 [Marasmius tenuissimus]|uniref:Mid2 domain-containing protein n=1 Tax=Marasmius tenuissimus TaxID=585030 RepID=A0ABR2ZPK3_9AGAR
MVFYKLFFILFLLPLVASFAVEAPNQVTVGKSAEVKWIRHNGDTSSFSLLLRRNDQDHGGVLITTIRSTQASQGTAQFTTDQATNYLIEVITDLSELADDQQPQRILASSSTIKSVQDSNPPATTQNIPLLQSSSNFHGHPADYAADHPKADSHNHLAFDEYHHNFTFWVMLSFVRRFTSLIKTSIVIRITTQVVLKHKRRAKHNQRAQKGMAIPASGTGGEATSTGSSPTSESPSNLSTNSGSPPAGGDSSIPATSTGSGTGTGPTPTDSSSPEPPLAGATSKKNNLGVILGSVFGGLLFILLIFILLFAYNRRKRRQLTREFAFRRDLMVARPSPDMEEQRSSENSRMSFWPVEQSYKSTDFTGESSTRETHVSSSDSFTEGLQAYQNYWNSQPETLNTIHTSNLSASTGTSTNASSSPSVFYTAVPQGRAAAAQVPQVPQPLYQTPRAALQQQQQPLYQTGQPLYQTSTQQPLYQTQQLAPGFTFPARPVSSTISRTVSTPTSTQTDRQTAIQNKINQLRIQMTQLQSENARGSGSSGGSTYSDGGDKVQNREGIQRIREEIGRLEEIMNSSWARRNESAGDLPAGLRT